MKHYIDFEYKAHYYTYQKKKAHYYSTNLSQFIFVDILSSLIFKTKPVADKASAFGSVGLLGGGT